MAAAVKWSREAVVDFIMRCRRDEGIPMFIPDMTGLELMYEGRPAVMAKCWAGRGTAPDSMVFVDVPREDVEFIRAGRSDWRRLLTRFAPEKMAEASRYGIYIHGYRIPRFQL